MRFSSKVLLFLLLLVSVAPLVTPTTHSTSTTTQATENQTSVLRDAAIALFSIFVSALIALMLDRRKDLQELRKEHLSTIKSEVLVPMLDELSQYDSRTYSNIAYAGVLVPLALKDLPVPVSKLYDTLPNHFPAMSASWNNYRLHIEKWSEKCVALYSSMKQSAEKQLQFEAASELDTKKVWRAIEELLKDVYFSLFDDRALEAIERFRIRGTIRLSLELRAKVNLQKEDFDSFEIKYGDAPLPAILYPIDARKVESALEALKNFVTGSLPTASGILEERKQLQVEKTKVESLIREGLATLKLYGDCQFCS